MPSAFLNPDSPYIYADPDSDLDYTISRWLEGLKFSAVTWAVAPTGPVLHNQSISNAPITIDGVTYAAGELATVWISGMTLNTDYVVTAHATFDGGQIDDRSFTIKCRSR